MLGEFHGQRRLAGCSPWGRGHTHTHTHTCSKLGEQMECISLKELVSNCLGLDLCHLVAC